MASTGGNLLQRTRCLYFYDTTTACNKRAPGSGCGARDGFNRMNAVLGWSEACIAVHPSDMCVALAALEALVHVTGPNGDRAIAFAEFHRLPDDAPEIDTTLAADEIVIAIELPAQGFARNFSYLKIRDRLSYALLWFPSLPASTSTAAPSSRRASRLAASRISPGAFPVRWRR